MKRHAPIAGNTQVIPTVSVNQEDRPISVTYPAHDWAAIINALESAQQDWINAVNHANQPLGPGLLALMERSIGKICDLREDLQRRLGAR